ncbi:hypothetical protein Y032_0028g1706 [Ancylostoma ceylanicum]|uniref:Reverse transcriptase domain-containing protein n=1 Tax=Ancylostoma ceylanicum TaxID=53326 RepID=A0A016URW4_9BILA|nr:hypothetical protein Y032_0028g1706 [Ancylostoma ceylanicum]
MYVKVENSFSDCFDCHSGVPQGGVLSPLLFLAYSYDLPQILKTHYDVRIQMYADDIKIYGSYTEQNKNEVHAALCESLRRMIDWANFHEIPLNLDKTTVFHIGKISAGKYMINGTVLPETSQVKDLGLLLDAKMNFSSHIDHVVKKAFSVLFIILRNVRCNDKDILIRLYKSYVLPHLEYCSQVWSPYTKKLQRKIEKVQQTFTRILYHKINLNYNPSTSHYLPSYGVRLKSLKLESLIYRRVLHDVLFCFRVVRSDLKLRASKYWSFKPTHGRVGGFALNCKGFRAINNRMVLNSLFQRGARWLNMLPLDVLNSPNFFRFRNRNNLERCSLFDMLRLQDY